MFLFIFAYMGAKQVKGDYLDMPRKRALNILGCRSLPERHHAHRQFPFLILMDRVIFSDREFDTGEGVKIGRHGFIYLRRFVRDPKIRELRSFSRERLRSFGVIKA